MAETITQAPRTSEGPPPTKLYMALHKARAAMTNVGKGGFNKFDKYTYATLADYLTAIQKPLDDNGLLIVSHVDDITWLNDRETKQGGFEKVCHVKLRTVLIHAESGESISVTVLGEGQDRGDKAFYKADTGARKYALANLFNLATDDDPEIDSPQAESRSNGRPQVTQQQQRGGPPEQSQPAQETELESIRRQLLEKLKEWPAAKILPLIESATSYDQIELLVDGCDGGEAWLDRQERGQIIDAVKAKYVELLNKQTKAPKSWDQNAFVQKMKTHRDRLNIEIQADETFDREAKSAADRDPA